MGISKWYGDLIQKYPGLLLAAALLVTLGFGLYLPKFSLDASGDTLMLEGDEAYRTFLDIQSRYPTPDVLIVTFTPDAPMFAPETLATLDQLSSELAELEGVASIYGILDVPLLLSPKVSLMSLMQGFKTLRDEGVGYSLAEKELTESPMFRNLLISADGKTTALQVTLQRPPDYDALAQERNQLREQRDGETLTAEGVVRLQEVEQTYAQTHQEYLAKQQALVTQIRAIIDNYSQHGDLYLGGVPMIVADMIDYVRMDLKVFGAGVFLFLVLALALVFRRPRWVILPLLCCAAAGIFTIGLLGFAEWPATVISSNFVSLLLIVTMSMTIHLVVRYQELCLEQPTFSARELAARSAIGVGLPCFYCTLTTMVGFGSLIASGIRPVMDFGKMMALGIGAAFILTFMIFPACLALLPKLKAGDIREPRLMNWFANQVKRRGTLLLVIGCTFFVAFGFGIQFLKVENRFIDYFKEDTEIYRGMVVVDEALGGTTPLEIVLRGEGDDFWFQQEQLDKLRKLDAYLGEKDEIGHVMSLVSVIRVIETLNDGKPLNSFMLRMARGAMPKDFKSQVLRPFAMPDYREVRFLLRVQETSSELNRTALLNDLDRFLREDMEMAPEDYDISGVYVLYNNMLESLFQSQIMTLGVVYAAIFLMFVILFWSVRLALIAMVPNLFPPAFVLGSMGYLGLPLDIMTITIAAITIGIAVDHTIHYVIRFKREFVAIGDYRKTVAYCHGHIGRAMYYTSLTIIFGFSILVLSQFKPTVYFGIFTGLAMIVALVAALTLLPVLLVMLKPLGKEKEPQP